MSRTFWSECVQFRRKWTAVATTGSARKWFFAEKLTQDTKRETAGATTYKGSKWWLQKSNFAPWANEQDSSEQSRKERNTILMKTWMIGLGILLYHVENTLYLGPIQILKQTLKYRKHRDGPWSQNYLSSHVHEIEIQICSTSGDETEVWVVTSRSSNRFWVSYRYRQSENLLQKSVQESVQEQETN